MVFLSKMNILYICGIFKEPPKLGIGFEKAFASKQKNSYIVMFLNVQLLERGFNKKLISKPKFHTLVRILLNRSILVIRFNMTLF